jgi:hypothetical protein
VPAAVNFRALAKSFLRQKTPYQLYGVIWRLLTL